MPQSENEGLPAGQETKRATLDPPGKVWKERRECRGRVWIGLYGSGGTRT